MSKVEDMLDEIMSDLGIRDEIARSLKQTEDKGKYKNTSRYKETGSLNTSYNVNNQKNSRERYMSRLLGVLFTILLNVIFYAAVVVAIVNVSTYAFDFAYDIYAGSGQDEEGKNIMFEIEEGTSSLEVAEQLEVNNIVSNRYSFWIRVKLSQKNIQANTYTLSTDMTYEEIIDAICR